MRIQRTAARAIVAGYQIRFPLAELGITKQEAADWCVSLGVRIPRIYEWSEHANCLACVRGGKNYQLACHQNAPEAFYARADLEDEFGHTVLKDIGLRELVQVGVKRVVPMKERIVVTCECGD